MKLIPITDYVLASEKSGMEVQSINHQQSERTRRYYDILNYAKFLKTPLNIGMFVPCDLCYNVLDEPKVDNYMQPKEIERQYKPYQEALERVLFKGFEIQNNGGILRFYNKESDLKKMWAINYSFNVGFQDRFKTIEDLTTLGLELKKAL